MSKIQKFCMLITLHLRVLYGSQNKQQLLPYTALNDCLLYPWLSVYSAVRIESLYNAETIRF
jgi:hypothetical protein